MKTLIGIFLLVTSIGGFAQGTIDFNNRVATAPLDAPITYASGGPAPAGLIDGSTAISAGGYVWGGVNAMAGLYVGPVGSTEDQFTLLSPSVGFRTGITAGYVYVGVNGSRIVPGLPQGSSALFQIRAWDAGVSGVNSYEDALLISQTRFVYLGKSGIVYVPSLGGMPASGPPIIPPDLLGLQPFSLTGSSTDVLSPEPSVLWLCLVGLPVFWVFQIRSRRPSAKQ